MFLRTVDLAEVQHVSLDDPTVGPCMQVCSLLLIPLQSLLLICSEVIQFASDLLAVLARLK